MIVKARTTYNNVENFRIKPPVPLLTVYGECEQHISRHRISRISRRHIQRPAGNYRRHAHDRAATCLHSVHSLEILNRIEIPDDRPCLGFVRPDLSVPGSEKCDSRNHRHRRRLSGAAPGNRDTSGFGSRSPPQLLASCQPQRDEGRTWIYTWYTNTQTVDLQTQADVVHARELEAAHLEAEAMHHSGGIQYGSYATQPILWVVPRNAELWEPIVTWPGWTRVTIRAGGFTTTGQAPRMTLVVDGRPIETWVLEAGLGSWREATYTASIRTGFGRPVLALRFADTLDRRSPPRLQHAYVDRIQLRWTPATGVFREGRPPGPIGPARTTTPRDGEFGGTIEVGETDLLRARRVPAR